VIGSIIGGKDSNPGREFDYLKPYPSFLTNVHLTTQKLTTHFFYKPIKSPFQFLKGISNTPDMIKQVNFSVFSPHRRTAEPHKKAKIRNS
jgi:hypothetical protein